MKISRAFISLLSLPILLISAANATVTHTAKVTFDLIQIDQKGHESSLNSESGDFALDWTSKKCEVRLSQQKYVYCSLDTSQDISTSKGELIMKGLPQAHFDFNVMNALFKSLAPSRKKDSISNLSGFNLPFYTCGNCEKNGKDLILYNAYQSYVIREIPIDHPYLSSTKTVLRVKLENMNPVKGAFVMAGTSSAADQGH